MRKMLRAIGALCALCSVYFVCYSIWEIQSLQTVAMLYDSQPVVVIDAGHGGEDSGTLSAAGIKESDINLSIALKLDQVLALFGIRTRMIRTEDISVASHGNTIRERKRSDLNNRIDITNNTEYGILVSIHQNHFSQSKYHGAQVFYADTAGSKELALKLQNMLIGTLDRTNQREIKKSESVYLMEKIGCTAILVECGFLSNPTEAMLLQQDVYQKKISGIICCALSQYIEEGKTYIEI